MFSEMLSLISYMYWTNWKPHQIWRAGMDGGDMKILIGSNLTHPNGLAIDYVGIPRLYWIDTGNLNIKSCTLDGQDIQVRISSSGFIHTKEILSLLC